MFLVQKNTKHCFGVGGVDERREKCLRKWKRRIYESRSSLHDGIELRNAEFGRQRTRGVESSRYL